MDDKDAIMKALREAKASWQTDGLGVRGTPLKHGTPLAVSPGGRFSLKVQQTSFQPSFPEATSTATTATEDSSQDNNEYSFKLSLVKVDASAYTVKIHVGYGEINDTAPDGMTGADDYILTIPGAADGTEIYALVTYDPDTLEITSRSLAFDFSVPESTLGTLYVPIGFVDFTYGGSGEIQQVFPHNRQCGDINVEFFYGELNGARALFPVRIYSNAVEVPD